MIVKYACIVVGSGIAGCLVAYRLQKHLPRGSVLLVDQASRLGGRILTVDDGMGGIMEFGAMRISEHHYEAISLFNELGISLENFNGIFKKNGLLYIDGQQRRIGHDIVTSEDVLNHAMSEYINKHSFNARSGQKSQASLLNCLEQDFNCSYYELAFSEVIHHILTPFQYDYYKRSCGYDYFFRQDVSFHGVVSSNRGLQYGCKYYEPIDGMYTVIDKLCKAFIDHGGRIHLKQSILSLQSGNEEYVVNTDKRSYHAQTIIFAIPPHLLSKVDGLSSKIEPSLKHLSTALGHYSSLKTFAYFEDDWWSSLIISDRKTCEAFRTDLPLRQGIYPNIASPASQAMLIEYRNCMKSDPIEPLQTEEYSQYLSMIHGLKVPQPSMLWRYNWIDSSSGIAAHYLKTGAKFSDLHITASNQIKNIYFAGEAFSTQHGWISGAIESVNRLLIENPILDHLRLTLRD